MAAKYLGVVCVFLLAACGDDGSVTDESCPTGSFGDACAPWTDCGPGDYVASTGTATSDRQCASCAAGSYSASTNASACTAWSECDPGEHVTTGGSATADRTCTSCASGTYSTSANAAACTAWSTCTAGQYVSAPGSAAADQSCSGCASGTFSTSTNASACQAWSTCAAGTYVTNTPSATVDRTCAACASGTYTSGPNQSACQPQNACPAGTVQTAPGTSTTPPVCAACTAGTYCAGGTAAAVACAANEWDDDGAPATACVAKTSCVAGEYVVSDGSATTDRSCTACADGTFSTATNAASCATWSTCDPGEYIAADGSASTDRTCTACADGSYSATTNAGSCTAWTTCAAGAYVSTPGTVTTDRSCAGCSDGTFSTTNNAASCTAWTTCVAGEYMTAAGTDATDRACAGCASGTFSTTTNAAACTPWTTCPSGTAETTAGTATTDRTCKTVEWLRQFGTSGTDYAYSVGVDAAGNVIVAGRTQGALPGQTSAGLGDAFVRKYDATGNVLWTRQFGSNADDLAMSVSVDASGSLLVAGYTYGALPGQTSVGSQDAYVMKYDGAGNLLWTRQFGTTNPDLIRSVSIDASGNAIVVGQTNGVLPGETSAGGADAFVRKYDGAGNVVWTRQFGTSGSEIAYAVTVDAAGNIVVGGATAGALPGQTSAGSNDAFVRKYDNAGNVLWTRQFGTTGIEQAMTTSVDANANIFVAGYTDGALLGQTAAGANDVFVRKYDATGNELWTRQFGSTDADIALSTTIDPSGNVAIVGYTYGALPGQTSAGGVDAFVRQYDTAGTVIWTRQFGTGLNDLLYATRADAAGNLLAAGYTEGVLPNQSSAGSYDAFVTRIVP